MCTSPSEGNSSLPYFSCSVHARCLTEKGGWLFLCMEPELATRKGCFWHIPNTPPAHGSKGKPGGKLFCSYGRVCVEQQTSAEGLVLILWKAMAVSKQDAFREREGENKGLNMTAKGLRQLGKKQVFVQNQLLSTVFQGGCSVLACWSALPPWSPALSCPPRACQLLVLWKREA